MALAPRNAPCPCGSGRKFKKCCGFDRTKEQEIEDHIAALAEVAGLASRSPRLLPVSPAYNRWADDFLAGRIEAEPGDAIATLDASERRRVVAACLDLFRDEWSELSRRCNDEAAAVEALLAGSAAAGIRDRQPPARFARSLGLVEESDALAEDPFMALALSFDGEALWSLEEGREAERAVDAIPDWVDDDEYERRWQVVLDATAAHLATDWHRARLGQLVRTRQAQLPFAGFPRASKAIRDGCERFTGDEAFRARLAAILLGTLIGRDQLIALRALLAA